MTHMTYDLPQTFNVFERKLGKLQIRSDSLIRNTFHAKSTNRKKSPLSPLYIYITSEPMKQMKEEEKLFFINKVSIG